MKIYVKGIFTGDYRTNFVNMKNYFVFKEFIDGFLVKEGEDGIIDKIIKRWKIEFYLFIYPLIILIINVIITIIIIGLKHGL